MNKHTIKENEFSPAPGGTNGTVNYQVGYGTHSSPDASQNPAHFANSNQNKTVDRNSNTAKKAPDGQTMEKDLNALYSKKDVPTPDEIKAGIKYEMSQQIKTNKSVAIDLVLQNLKKDPHYYSSLKMLNIDDESMVQNMTENKHPNDAPAKLKVTSKVSETKKIFADLAKERDNKYAINSGITEVMRKMWDVKRSRNEWKQNPS